MAQSNEASMSWRRGEKPSEPEPERPRLYVHHDELSRYIDDILDGKIARTEPSLEHVRNANGWPAGFRGWLIFAAMMTLAVWGIVKIALL